jgi:hypothetical protein
MPLYKPYSIITPEYQITSGGIRVMYALQSWLETRGQIAWVNQFPQDTHKFITIYPEISQGNVTNADYAVRYILNTPGNMTTNGIPGPTQFSPLDKIYVFSRIYNTAGVDESHLMFLPVLNTHLFKVTNTNKRKFKCKLIGKGKDLHLKETEGLFELTRPFANDQGALADYLNECELMYSYDPNSAMFEIARLCGCRVVIVPSFFKRDEFAKYEPGMNGISWGFSEEKPLDAVEFRNHYLKMRDLFAEKLDYFIEDTQTWKI